jgi:hypothetical protein
MWAKELKDQILEITNLIHQTTEKWQEREAIFQNR